MKALCTWGRAWAARDVAVPEGVLGWLEVGIADDAAGRPSAADLARALEAARAYAGVTGPEQVAALPPRARSRRS